jgi:hypothetical protein
VATVTATRARILRLSDGRVECLALVDGEFPVSLSVQLPPGYPEGRRHGVERYALAAVAAIADKIGRDE